MADKSAQLKYLKERLESVMRRKNVFYGHERIVRLPKPPAVLAAERLVKTASKVVARFEKKEERANKRAIEKKKDEYEACRKEVFFGDPRKALKLLDQFEAKW